MKYSVHRVKSGRSLDKASYTPPKLHHNAVLIETSSWKRDSELAGCWSPGNVELAQSGVPHVLVG